MEKTFPMTKEGLDKLKAELENLKLVKRPEVIDRIKVARSYGDLSENSEYEAAKDEQAFIEGRISTVETMIRYAEIVDNAKIAKDEVALGKNVTFVEVGETDEESYQIVGTAEADPFTGKISNESPIAKALMGHSVGDTVSVDSPNGNYEIKIIEIG